VANIEFDKLLLQNLEAINKKLEDVNKKFDDLPCSDRLVRLDRLEQQVINRKETSALMWSVLVTAIGAFGLSIWNWVMR